MKSAIFCGHANECPTGASGEFCKCAEDCACRETMCTSAKKAGAGSAGGISPDVFDYLAKVTPTRQSRTADIEALQDVAEAATQVAEARIRHGGSGIPAALWNNLFDALVRLRA